MLTELDEWRAWAREMLGNRTVDVFGDHAARQELAALIPRLDPGTEERCPGRGRCHACMSWCVFCGDVENVCDAPRGQCDCHPEPAAEND
jgi:hypothetical protein